MTTTIQQARDVLAKWRKESTAAPWRVSTYGHGGQFTDIVQPAESQPDYDPDRFDNMDLDVASIKESDGDARLIVGTAGNPELLDAIDGFLKMVDDGMLRDRQGHAQRIATAIVAADERMNADA